MSSHNIMSLCLLHLRDFCMPLLGASICPSSRKSSRSFPEDQVLDSQSSKIVTIITVNGILCPNGLTKDRIFLPQDISMDLFQHCIVHHMGDDWVRVWSVSQEIKLEFQPPFQLNGHCMEVSISDSISFLRSPCISSAQCIPVSSLSVFQQYSGLGLFCSPACISRTLIIKYQRLWGQCSWLPLTFAPEWDLY